MENKGFTLLEMLAVVLILGILAAISIPIIQNVIYDARSKTIISSAKNYIRAVETYIADSDSDEGEMKVDIGNNSVSKLKPLISIDGKEPNDGFVTLDDNYIVTYAELYIDGFKIIYNGKSYEISKAKDKQENNGETHKGIVYLDPTNLNRKCTKADVLANVNEYGTPTGIKTGCMKWYIYKIEGSNYKMILDHNTTARIQWNATGESGINVELSSSNLQSELAYLSSKSGSEWKVTADLISVQDILNIVGGVSTFNVSDDKSWFYLDGTGDKKQTMSSYDANNRNKYAWLYDYTYKCKSDRTDYGCNHEDNFANYETVVTVKKGPIYGYWTKNPVGTAGSGKLVWLMGSYGNLHHNYAINEERGIRPVIAVPKSLVTIVKE